MRPVFSVLIALTMMGCANYGPTERNPDFNKQILAATHPEDSIEVHSSKWFPNSFGFNNTALGNIPAGNAGIFVLTETRVLFLVWSDSGSRYIRSFALLRENIDEIVMDFYGLNQRLVILADNSVNTFAILGDTRQRVDKETTNRIGELLGFPGEDK